MPFGLGKSNLWSSKGRDSTLVGKRNKTFIIWV